MCLGSYIFKYFLVLNSAGYANLNIEVWSKNLEFMLLNWNL